MTLSRSSRGRKAALEGALSRAATLTCLLVAAAVQAGDSAAGPAASGGPGVGSIVTPGSHAMLNTAAKDHRNQRVLPGNGGAITLTGDQLAKTAEALRGFNGVNVSGAMIVAPTVLADGTPAVIALHTGTGRLAVTRKEK